MRLLTRTARVLVFLVPLLLSIHAVRAADIVDRVGTDSKFTVLLVAFKAAGLDDILKSKGPFTLFAPTDEAFAKLPAGMMEQLLQPENMKMLRSLLRYHVLGGKILKASRIIEVGNFDFVTLEGSRAEINMNNGPSIENARIVQADIMTNNGVIHMIDAVLLPPTLKKQLK